MDRTGNRACISQKQRKVSCEQEMRPISQGESVIDRDDPASPSRVTLARNGCPPALVSAPEMGNVCNALASPPGRGHRSRGTAPGNGFCRPQRGSVNVGDADAFGLQGSGPAGGHSRSVYGGDSAP